MNKTDKMSTSHSHPSGEKQSVREGHFYSLLGSNEDGKEPGSTAGRRGRKAGGELYIGTRSSHGKVEFEVTCSLIR